MQDIYDRYSEKGMKMVAINVIPEQDAMVSSWAERGGYSFPILVGANTERIFEDYRMTAAPLNYLLDSKGMIIARFEGYTPGDEKEIEAVIQEALKTSLES